MVIAILDDRACQPLPLEGLLCTTLCRVYGVDCSQMEVFNEALGHLDSLKELASTFVENADARPDGAAKERALDVVIKLRCLNSAFCEMKGFAGGRLSRRQGGLRRNARVWIARPWRRRQMPRPCRAYKAGSPP